MSSKTARLLVALSSSLALWPERSLGEAENTLAGVQRADELAAAEAEAKLDPRPAAAETEGALRRARRALRNLD